MEDPGIMNANVKMFVAIICLAEGMAAIAAPDFEVVPYNNPDLVVDLGVGLWALPLPMDYDGDGITDLVVYRENDVTSPGFPVWYIRKSPSNFGSAVAQQWGLTNDVAYGDRPGSTN